MSNPGSSPTSRPMPLVGTDGVSDERLLAAFNELRDELLSTLMFMLGNRDDAQDAAQEAFLKCWRSRDGLGSVLNLRAWIFRVGLNVARDQRRRAWGRRSRPLFAEGENIPDRSAPPEDSLGEREELELLREALQSLRPEEQEVFLMRQNGGLTYEQIAEISRRPVGTVKTQMRAALQKLRTVLKTTPSDE